MRQIWKIYFPVMLVLFLTGCTVSQDTAITESTSVEETDSTSQTEKSSETAGSESMSEIDDSSIQTDTDAESEMTADDANTEQSSGEQDFHGLDVTFDYVRQSTEASNQIAVWIEDEDGHLVKTIYVTNFTAAGGYAKREETLSHWIAKAGISEMNTPNMDAVSGATPATGTVEFQWDGTDASGNIVSSGNYKVLVEGTLYWSDNVLFEAKVNTDQTADPIEIEATFSTENAANKDMIANVSIGYIN